MLHVAGADPFDDPDGELARSFDLAPELFLREIVVLREAGDAVLTRLSTQQPAGLALAGERAVETAERLDADEVAQHEHVQRNLEALLGLDLLRRVRVLARLVVLDDPPRAERIDVDAVDLPRQRDALGELEATLELGCRAFRSEEHLEPARNERHVCGGLFADEGFEVAPEAVPELTPLEIGQLDTHALHRIVQAPPQEGERILDPIRLDAVRAELLGQTGIELEERLVRDRPAQARIDARIDALRIDQPLEEPDRRAVREPLELRDAEG